MSFTSSKQALSLRVLASLFSFLYLQLLLLSAFLRPSIEIEEQWVPKSFFFSSKQSTCNIQVQFRTMSLFESIFFSAIALIGYCQSASSELAMENCSMALANFEMSMMGMQQKYYWISYVPWIITFIQNWLQNVCDLVILLSGHTIYEANDYIAVVVVLIMFFAIQAMLASEVMCMALQGCHVMHYINEENIMWEKRMKMFFEGKINL